MSLALFYGWRVGAQKSWVAKQGSYTLNWMSTLQSIALSVTPPPYLASLAVCSKTDLSWEPWDQEPRPGTDITDIPVFYTCFLSFFFFFPHVFWNNIRDPSCFHLVLLWARERKCGRKCSDLASSVHGCLLSLNSAEMESFERESCWISCISFTSGVS